jgi:4-hydroxybenzoate polyprenyltransferase
LSLSNPIPLLRSLAAVLLFCFLSSSVYIINDLLDIEADRQHPIKRNRPIASGKLPVSVAVAAAALMTVVTLVLAYLLSPTLALIALLYFLMNLAYSTRLKHVALVDVLIIAAGFVLRVGAGVVVINVERFSPWLYVVMTLGALYIGFGKRRAELTLLADKANSHRRVLQGYNLPLLDQLITIVSSSTILTYSLYTFSAPNLPENHVMMLTIPFVLYGVFRYLYLIHVAGKGGEPEELLLTDRPLQIDILLWVVSVLVIFYAF